MTESDEIHHTTSAGEQLRAAREANKLSLDEVATQTRIPLRHLQSLEASDWSRLPAPTYTIGFAKSYASAVGLDRNEIAEQLRAEMGGVRPEFTTADVFEPADPARTMPRWLVLSALGAVVFVVLLLTWLNKRSLEPEPATTPEAAATAPQEAAPAPVPQQQPQAQPAAANGPVVLFAREPVWIQVTDQGKTLFSGELATGQSFTVPSTATAPLLKAGKPEALRVNVGAATAPPVGTPGHVASKVSLLPADLMKAGPGTPLAPNAQATPTPPAPSAPPGAQNTAE